MTTDIYIIRLARFNAGLTQKELAEKAGVSLRTISNAERGKSISPRANRAIRDALGLE